MNPPKCQNEDYLNVQIAPPRQVSATETARVQPQQEQAPVHDVVTRLLQRLEADPETLWGEAQTQADLVWGLRVLDDSTVDKPYAKPMEWVTRHWSGKHHAVVRGTNQLTLRWTEGDGHVPCDYRVFDKAKDGLTKNDPFQHLLNVVHARGFRSACVVFDSWDAGVENVKLLRSLPWLWLTRLKSNRHVNPDRQGLRPLRAVEIGEQGRVVWLDGERLIRVFKIVAPDGDSEYWATNKLEMDGLERVTWANFARTIENYPRGVKQSCLSERAQVRSGRAWRSHIGLCLWAFLRLESHVYYTGLSWFEAKTAILREAVRQYLPCPLYRLLTTA